MPCRLAAVALDSISDSLVGSVCALNYMQQTAFTGLKLEWSLQQNGRAHGAHPKII
jgi:hypothetical protein